MVIVMTCLIEELTAIIASRMQCVINDVIIIMIMIMGIIMKIRMIMITMPIRKFLCR